MGNDRPAGFSPNIVELGSASTPSWLTEAASVRVREAEEQAFPDEEYAARLADVRERMAHAELDAMVVFRPSSVEYLCGFYTAETAPQPLLVTASETYLYIPDLEVGRALASSRVDEIRFCGYADALRGLELFLGHAATVLPRGARVGVEVGHASTPPRAVELLREQGFAVRHPDYLVERARLVLSPAELRCVEQAAVATQAGVEAAVVAAREPDATDSSVAASVAEALYRDANSPSAWGPVVATGRRGGIPHSSWVDRPLGDGPTFIEFAGTHHRYHAPVMRTLVRGELSAADARLAELARTAVAAVLEHARDGVTAGHVATEASWALGDLPDDVMFHRLLGYPVGLAHKPHWMDGVPFYLTPDNDEPLRSGMVFHIPGSFRSFGNSGVGLSQTFVVERDGARPLTHGAADLITL
ncbi:aminopeptidase P family protein [Streptomyces sp. AJS327]|uniref:M24 family metallopeptidase n=1 Tax=Streptomyces sp. AJS327 TaxID=2545265 RepID=UPI0015DDB112|nr:Xaa-Pro peptidase family protein [Streptomyces sp. AJS327]MBA0049932.1 aminopeptidase P family protein [Streptomyces sp. AJS327]